MTFVQMKTLIHFCQTDSCFVAYLQTLARAGVLVINDGDIDEEKKEVSPELRDRLVRVFGLTTEEAVCPDLS
ncbi:TPA: hypothetical protein KMD82_001779 [Escherichia coli]|uniref:hypothetical protein n=1 Tax=Escherichia coli TaxID=562 RepID=UPI0002A2B225|nr:hypothetical protein [Escherichia coli]EFB3999279.1 hypothetical protein [Escherichia coli]ELG00626.1 hypothetical protein A1S5_01888 [Escherichia coli KTE48]MBS9069321.1 hypothetical protein [Escherichia coli]MBS9108144.1 hypothetical protein [Escherichia coli]GDE77204.1 hypothetical protein HmCmsJML281_02592 [Escherichia coli]